MALVSLHVGEWGGWTPHEKGTLGDGPRMHEEIEESSYIQNYILRVSWAILGKRSNPPIKIAMSLLRIQKDFPA